MSYLDIDLEIKSVQNFCGCDLERCSNLAECMCCEGLPTNGGKPLNKHGVCEHFCFTDPAGFSFCGDGPLYEKGEDCRKCISVVGN